MTHKSVTALGNGYEEVSYTKHDFNMGDEPAPPRVSLQHRGSDDQVSEIWPSLAGSATVIHGKMVIFDAEKANLADHTTRPRLFAVQSADVPVDITDEVLWLWAKSNGKSVKRTLDKFAEMQPSDGDAGLQIHIDFLPETDIALRDDWPEEGSILLNWKQVAEIMQLIKTKGVPQKDQRWHTPYISE